jgi:hypothetical protein
MENYNLESSQYTIKNALLWGNCKEHFKKAFEKGQTWSGKIVHFFIGLLEAIPVVGQIASLAEKTFSQNISKGKPITSETRIQPIVYTVPKEAKEGIDALNIVRDMIREGTPIDRDYIMINYPKLLEKVGEENEIEAQKLINAAYLQQLQERVESGSLPLPQGLIALLKHQGKEKLIQEHEANVREEMSLLLKSVDINNLKDKEPIVFVNELRDLLFNCIAQRVSSNHDEQEQFKADLTQLHKLELRWVELKRIGKDYIRDTLIPEFNKVIDDLPEELQNLKEPLKVKFREELLKLAIPDKTQKQLEEVLKDDTSTLEERVAQKLTSPSDERFKVDLEKKAVDLLMRLAKEMGEANDWMKTYNCTHVIKYSQSAGGNDEILGDGCCYAINLKWGSSLQYWVLKDSSLLNNLIKAEN